MSKTGGTIQLRLDKVDGPVIAQVKIPESSEWNVVNSLLLKHQPGMHNLVVQSENNNNIEIDWVKFK